MTETGGHKRSSPRALHLERVTRWWVENEKLHHEESDRTAVANDRGPDSVVWAHWEPTDAEVNPGDEPELDDFLATLEAEGGAWRTWKLNLSLPWSGGGFRVADPSRGGDGNARGTFFDVVSSEVRFQVPSGPVTAEELRRTRPVVQRTHLASLGLAGLLLTVRFPTSYSYREGALGEHEGGSGDDYRWHAPDLERIVRTAYEERPLLSHIQSGDLLAPVALEVLREADRTRSWFVTDLEELENEQLKIESDAPDTEERRRELQRRYRWLLEQVTESRVALDWRREDRDPLDWRWEDRAVLKHFSEPAILDRIEDLRGEQHARLYDFKQDVRASLELFSTVLMRDALELTRREQRHSLKVLEHTRADQQRSAGLQRALTYISATVLVPGLVVGVFDALPSIFAQNTWARAATLFGVMLLTGLLTFVWTRSWRESE